MCQRLLSDSTLFESLQRLDEEMAAEVRSDGCPCGGRLHRADYPRKPRGGPRDPGRGYERRLSWCCGVEGCRRRRTPPSVRFLGRRVYLGAVVVLATALASGWTPSRVRQVQALVGVSARTLRRWRQWWCASFPASRSWREARGRFSPPVDESALPASLLSRWGGGASGLIALLRFLAPLTSAAS